MDQILPALASQQGAGFDHFFALAIITCTIIFVPVQLALLYAVLRYRDKSGAASKYSKGHNGLEILWTAVSLVVFVGLNVLGQPMWAKQRFESAPAGSLQVEVTGEQFAWTIRYPGADGKFGKTNPKLIDDAAGNPLGLDPSDADALDDIVTPSLVVPVDRPLEVLLHSKDVIHNFFVREMRIKQDAVPGMEIRIHFTPSKLGTYEIACSELCGAEHYKMRAFMRVVTAEEYAKFLKERAK